MIEKILNFLEFRNKVEAIFKSRSLATLTNDYFQKEHKWVKPEMERWYKELLPSLNFNTCCNNSISDAFWHLKSLSINIIFEKMTLLHKLKDGIIKDLNGRRYSSQSPDLTNEICQQLHDKYGDGIFENFDKNWKEKVKNLEEVKQQLKHGETATIDPKSLVLEDEETYFEDEPEEIKEKTEKKSKK